MEIILASSGSPCPALERGGLQAMGVVSDPRGQGKGFATTVDWRGYEFVRFSELRGKPPLIDGRARRTRGTPVCVVRRGCWVVEGQEQMIAPQCPEGFEPGTTARGSS